MFNIIGVDRDRPVLNNDGVSVRGCKFIYAPQGQMAEIASLATNPYRGCGYKCAYCYVPDVTKQPRSQFDAGAFDRHSYLAYLANDAAKYEERGVTEQVMLSCTCDPYHAGDTKLTRQALEVIIAHGMGICTLTKGGTRSLRDIDLFRPTRDAFACSLTSLDDSFSREWETDAALPGDRLEALQEFHRSGIFTWVVIEPALDVETSIAIVERTHQYVDLYKVGRANRLPATETVDWETYTHRMVALLSDLNKPHYIKRNLQHYLPENYWNPLKVPQHHWLAVNHAR